MEKKPPAGWGFEALEDLCQRAPESLPRRNSARDDGMAVLLVKTLYIFYRFCLVGFKFQWCVDVLNGV